MDAASTSSGTGQSDNMTANSKLMGASAPNTEPTWKGKAAATQKTLPNRTHEQGRTTADGQNRQQGSDVDREPEDTEPTAETGFTPTQCLFCSANSPDFESNLSHMSRSHSLFIPAAIDNGSLTLAVDLETLVRYMHLVVHTYHECLLCHTQRQSPRAVQQHMTGKGHCRIDLEDDESEFRDFYESPKESKDENDSSGEETRDSEDEDAEQTSMPGDAAPLRLREGSLLLSSGKLLSHRSAPTPKHHRPLAETQKLTRRGLLAATSAETESLAQPSNDEAGPSEPTPDAPTADTGRALTRLERRAESNNRSTLSMAMARMSLSDRAALAHLPAAEQRGVVLRQSKQQDRARHESRRFWSRMERKNNSLLMKHFVSDVPGPKLG